MKTIAALVTCSVLLLASSWIDAEDTPARPPGVQPMDWIPISATAGIVVAPPSPYGDRAKPTLSGKLMARRGSTWYAIDLAPVQFTRTE